MHRLFAAALVAITALAATPSFAEPEMKRQVLSRADLTGKDGTEVIMTLLEAPPGAVLPRHTHHGDEFLYVLSGGKVQPPGKEPIALPTGASQHFPRDVPHGGFTVAGEDTIKVLTVHIVDKGRPLVELVK